MCVYIYIQNPNAFHPYVDPTTSGARVASWRHHLNFPFEYEWSVFNPCLRQEVRLQFLFNQPLFLVAVVCLVLNEYGLHICRDSLISASCLCRFIERDEFWFVPRCCYTVVPMRVCSCKCFDFRLCFKTSSTSCCFCFSDLVCFMWGVVWLERAVDGRCDFQGLLVREFFHAADIAVSGSYYGSFNACDFLHINFFFKLVLGSTLVLLLCALVCVYIRDTFGFITGFSSNCLSYTIFVNHCRITFLRVDVWLLGLV